MIIKTTLTLELDFEIQADFVPGESESTAGPIDTSTPGYGNEAELTSIKINGAERKSGASPNLLFWLSDDQKREIEALVVAEVESRDE